MKYGLEMNPKSLPASTDISSFPLILIPLVQTPNAKQDRKFPAILVQTQMVK